jgi:hypothetical protein
MLAIDIPDPSDEASVADWIELCVGYEASPISKAAVSHKIEMASGSEPSDAFLSSIWDEMEARMNLYGLQPPFTVDSNEVTPNVIWRDNPEYIMCLILSLTGNPSNPTPTGKLFERISREAIKNYLGGEAIVTGHPNPYSVKDICELMCEKFKTELPSNYKDRGVDIIAWKPFSDNRGNQIVILIQCAGGHNWVSKTNDVAVRAWAEKYMGFKCYPVKGFSTAVVVTNSEAFEEVSFETHLLIDRTRIYSNTVNSQIEGTLRTEIAQWCMDRFAEILN